ncbi:MAG: tRNA (guanosine(46)-N7)-methyltransferase TrmB [Bacteroidales bacterium]|nr:tRNA (guanosine(46)-N7)-methyltransferase TrmB [Bacteroidales bacterium]MDD4602267.1 tRNA (guanosine(46)-N7)-methyltransferase TrmB [Bacteroidales bacterium]
MTKKKLIHFQENSAFPHLFQPTYHDLDKGFLLYSKWKENFFRNDHPIVVELGCGKGEYTIGLASLYPDLNFIGIDIKGARLWRGCKTVADQSIKNVGFVRTMVDHIERIFAPGEIAEIWITFPDPQVKKQYRRLTSPGFLEKYSHILSPNGIIHLKTDDPFFFNYTQEIIREHHHQLLLSTDDLYHSDHTNEVTNIQTFYEKRWLEMGKKIGYLRFQLCTQ